MKGDWISAWKKLPTKKKIFSLTTLICALAVIVFSILTLAGVGDFSLIFLPLMGVVSLLSGIETYSASRRSAIVSFVASGIVVACAIAIGLIKLLA